MISENRSSGYIQVLLSAVLFGSQSIFSDMAQRGGMDTLMFQLIRGALTSIILTAASLRPSGEHKRMEKRDLAWGAWLSVLGFILTPYLLISSFSYIGPGAATSLHFCHPLFVIVMSAVFYRDKISSQEMISLCVCMLGIAGLYTPGAVSVKGTLIALASGLTYAMYTLFLDRSRISERVGTIDLLRYFYLISTAVYFVICLVTGRFAGFRFTFRGIMACVISALLLNIIAVAMFKNGVKIVGSKYTAILSAAEPVVGILIGAAVFSEALSARNIAGCILIIISTMLLLVKRKRKNEDC